ncbi:hypothetical protein D9758_005731 [Tetrapyrgos nigripes]|uniref:Uncharacterized protein n=1 Tax=Tetrapyrgos nigripes TaxID=182062 RepID=A0A8H5GJL3_9AGAR|nr:hypothetical protein D9758_005731 [Tetrapyrgos nigripes]
MGECAPGPFGLHLSCFLTIVLTRRSSARQRNKNKSNTSNMHSTPQIEQHLFYRTSSASVSGPTTKKERRKAVILPPKAVLPPSSVSKFRLSKEMDWLMNELYDNSFDVPIPFTERPRSLDSISNNTPSLVTDSGSDTPYTSDADDDDDDYIDVDSYYFGRYDNDGDDNDTPDTQRQPPLSNPHRYTIQKDFVSIPSPEARLAGILELEKENKNPLHIAPIDASAQVDFNPEDYFWDVYPQPLYVYDGHLKTRFVSAAVIAQHRLKMESKAKMEKKSVVKRALRRWVVLHSDSFSLFFLILTSGIRFDSGGVLLMKHTCYSDTNNQSAG